MSFLQEQELHEWSAKLPRLLADRLRATEQALLAHHKDLYDTIVKQIPGYGASAIQRPSIPDPSSGIFSLEFKHARMSSSEKFAMSGGSARPSLESSDLYIRSIESTRSRALENKEPDADHMIRVQPCESNLEIVTTLDLSSGHRLEQANRDSGGTLGPAWNKRTEAWQSDQSKTIPNALRGKPEPRSAPKSALGGRPSAVSFTNRPNSPPAIDEVVAISSDATDESDEDDDDSGIAPMAPSKVSFGIQDSESFMGQTGTEDTNAGGLYGSDGSNGHEGNRSGVAGTIRGSAARVLFELLPTWEKTDLSVKKAKMGRVSNAQAVIAQVNAQDSMAVEEVEELQGVIHILNPHGGIRFAWDIMSLGLVLYDACYLPLLLAKLLPPVNIFFTVWEWVIRVFWTIDIIVSFFTGYVGPDGQIEMRFKQIVKRYLKTWFILDMVLVVMDWLEFAVNLDGLGVLRFGKVLKNVFRVLRMLRLVRLTKMKEVFKIISFRLNSERITILADIFKIILLIVGTTHIVACLWYGVGNSQEGEWVEFHGLFRLTLWHQYLISFHWALAQFCGGMDEFVAHTVLERFFNISIFLAAFVAAAVLVSSLTSSMTRLQILASTQSRQLTLLRRYLVQAGVSDRLSMRIQRNALHAITEQSRLMSENSVELLHLISLPLRVELHSEMYSPVLEVHPFFLNYQTENINVIRGICHEAMATLLVSSGDIVFNPGEIPDEPRMYIVCSGFFKYFHVSGENSLSQPTDYVSEAGLWTHWMHRGALRASCDSRMCFLDALKFQKTVAGFVHTSFNPKIYAKLYVAHLNELGADNVTDLANGNELELAMKCEGQKKTANIGGFTAKIVPTKSVMTGNKKMFRQESPEDSLKNTQSVIAPLPRQKTSGLQVPGSGRESISPYSPHAPPQRRTSVMFG